MTEQYRVLVIEDDLDVALYTKTVLEKKLGCRVITTPNPADVAAAVEELQPDVVISDIELPGTTGLELIESIRKQRPGVPVIIMTAHASVDYAVTAIRNQVDEFLTKPVNSEELKAHVVR